MIQPPEFPTQYTDCAAAVTMDEVVAYASTVTVTDETRGRSIITEHILCEKIVDGKLCRTYCWARTRFPQKGKSAILVEPQIDGGRCLMEYPTHTVVIGRRDLK